MRTVLIVQVEFVIGFNFSYGIYYIMTKMVLIFHIPESVVRLKSHGVRLNDDIYRYFLEYHCLLHLRPKSDKFHFISGTNNYEN